MGRRYVPAILVLVPILAILAGFLALGGPPWRTDAILERREQLREAAAARPLLTLALFMSVHLAIVSSALPVGPPMSLLAGFLFGRWLGTATILTSSTAGALVVFYLVRLSAGTGWGERLRARAGPLAARVAADVRANAFGYLLVARLVPMFPFFLVNILAGLFAVRPSTFLLATLIGRLPAAFLYVSLGEELGRVATIDELVSPGIVVALTGLGLLALLPVWLGRRRARPR